MQNYNDCDACDYELTSVGYPPRRDPREVIGVTGNQKYIPVVNPGRAEYAYNT